MAAKKKTPAKKKKVKITPAQKAAFERKHKKAQKELMSNIETARSRKMPWRRKSIGVSQAEIDLVSGKTGKKLLKNNKRIFLNGKDYP